MKKKTLGVYQFIHNAIEYDYPFLESLSSALPIADKIVVCDCASTDGTREILSDFARKNPKIEIIDNDWVTDWQQLSARGNYCVPFLSTDWSWQLQADEVIHEDSFQGIRVLVQEGYADAHSITALRVNYTHLVGSYRVEFPFMYKSIIRIAKRGGGWKLTGDACQLDGGDHTAVGDTDIQIFHYGKVHAGNVGWKKEIDFQNLFKELGFPDPRMKVMQEKLGEDFCDYPFLFQTALERGEFKAFRGAHPVVMAERIAAFEAAGFDQLASRVDPNLKVNL